MQAGRNFSPPDVVVDAGCRCSACQGSGLRGGLALNCPAPRPSRRAPSRRARRRGPEGFQQDSGISNLKFHCNFPVIHLLFEVASTLAAQPLANESSPKLEGCQISCSSQISGALRSQIPGYGSSGSQDLRISGVREQACEIPIRKSGPRLFAPQACEMHAKVPTSRASALCCSHFDNVNFDV